jgi:hypothetical protein
VRAVIIARAAAQAGRRVTERLAHASTHASDQTAAQAYDRSFMVSSLMNPIAHHTEQGPCPA